MGPSCGTSCTRSKLRMLSRVSIDGDNPPWRQNISDSTYKREIINHFRNITLSTSQKPSCNMWTATNWVAFREAYRARKEELASEEARYGNINNWKRILQNRHYQRLKQHGAANKDNLTSKHTNNSNQRKQQSIL